MSPSTAMRFAWPYLYLLLVIAAVDTTATGTTATGGGRVWTQHDPDFAVRVAVAPFADEQWNATAAELDALTPTRDGELAIPSSVLNVSVALPSIANITATEVSISLFHRPKPRATEEAAVPHDTDTSRDSQDGVAFVVLAEMQMPYAKSYRLDVGTSAQKMVLRVYVESQLTSGRVMRALYVRPVNLLPSEPFHPVCTETADGDVSLHLASYPPTNMPEGLCRQYTMDGRVPIRKWYFDDQTDTERTYEERSFEFIEELVMQAKYRKRYYYGKTDDFLHEALEKHPIQGKHVLIVGSTIPWYEAICIANEAASCTTVDYNRLRYHHPKLTTYTLGEFDTLATRKQFDVIFSISSFEHDGLGRYGDPLDPDADLKAMKDLFKYMKPQSDGDTATKVFLAVPVGADVVVWNAQRIYGPLRLPLLLEEWKVVDSFGFAKADFSAPFTVDHQPLFVLEQKASPASDQRTEL